MSFYIEGREITETANVQIECKNRKMRAKIQMRETMRNNPRNNENDFDGSEYFEDRRNKRARRRKRTRAYTIAGLAGTLIVLVGVMYLGVWLLDRSKNPETEDALAEQITYTQDEVDTLLAEIEIQAQEDAQQAAQDREAEILGGIQQSLSDGITVLKTLRPYYPDKLVLASEGKYHFVPIKDNLKHHTYQESNLSVLENGEFQYSEDGQVISHKGIDVSKHQGEINWQQVAEDGVEFAFIRVAYRGYGEEGKLNVDERFEENIEGALAAGIKVGVYIYSQAITEEELREEAEFVLEKIAPYKIECPVVYDVEKVFGADGRMNSLSVEERTKMAVLFCQLIENAGYKPMLYHNMEMAALMINLDELESYDKWFAYYSDDFYYPYDFSIWQYTEKGNVKGVKGEVDLNISFKPLWE